MNKTLIDTNVILRYLLDDVEELALMAEQVIEGGAWTTPEVLSEMTYVLESVYGFSRKDIASALNIIFIHVEARPFDVVKRAIEEYEASGLDFVDCMMIGYALSEKARVFTFDKGINRQLASCRESTKKP